MFAKSVALGITVLTAFLLSTGTGFCTESGDLDIFVDGKITEHTRSYERLADVDYLHIDDRHHESYFNLAPYEARWGTRAISLTIAYYLSPERDKQWIKRAIELAVWKLIQIRKDQEVVATPVWTDLIEKNGIPTQLAPADERDLETIDRVFFELEEGAGGNER